MDDVLRVVVVGLVFLFAGLVKGVIGLGLPTVAMGLLGLVMTPVEAAGLLLAPSLVTNVWQLMAGPGVGGLVRRLWGMLGGILVGTVAGSVVLVRAGSGGAMVGLGVALAVYGVVGLWGVRLRVPAGVEGWAGPLVGGVTGVVTGATGVFVVPAVPYLGSLGLGREALVQALGLSFTVSTVALGVGLWGHGGLGVGVVWGSLGAVVPAVVGMVVGGWVRGLVGVGVFRVWFFVGLLGVGGELVWRGVG